MVTFKSIQITNIFLRPLVKKYVYEQINNGCEMGEEKKEKGRERKGESESEKQRENK